MHLSELKALHVSALIEMAAGLEIENANRLRKQELMFAILKRRAKTGESILDMIAEQHRAGLTIVMVTHDQWIAARANRTVHLVDGKVADGLYGAADAG